jgi:acyl-CoA synthetase (AMP-forming)/AMP-acid ligase II
VSPRNLVDAVVRLAQEEPDAAAVIEVGDRPRTLSWSELKQEADRVSTALLDLGVQRGEAVAFQLPNWIECVTVALGVLQIGAVVAPVMPVFGPREVAMVLARAQARVLFTPEEFRRRRHADELADVVQEAARRDLPLRLEHVVVLGAGSDSGEPDSARSGTSWRRHDFTELVAAAAPDAERIAARRPTPDDIAQLLFTSGTTGEPKGVQHRHGTLERATAMEVAHLGLTRDDRIYVPSPLAHQTGFLYGLMLSWQLGAACVIQPIWDARIALRQAFAEARAGFVQAATPFLMDLVDAVESGEPLPESLRIFVATGAAVPRPLAERATRVLDTAVCGAFGTTETCLATLSAPDDPPSSAWGTDGRPLDGIAIRIVDDEGRVLPPGREGNYELSSPTLFVGYLDRPDLTAEVFTDDGWYRTGDLGVIDDDGFLHITGRLKDVVNRGGEKVPVVEIENLLFTHPAVKDVAIVAMPDSRLGERACAFVVVTEGENPMDLDDVREFLAAAGVSKYYWPERLELLDALPRNAVGKVQKNLLRDRAAELAAATLEDEPA